MFAQGFFQRSGTEDDSVSAETFEIFDQLDRRPVEIVDASFEGTMRYGST